MPSHLLTGHQYLPGEAVHELHMTYRMGSPVPGGGCRLRNVQRDACSHPVCCRWVHPPPSLPPHPGLLCNPGTSRHAQNISWWTSQRAPPPTSSPSGTGKERSGEPQSTNICTTMKHLPSSVVSPAFSCLSPSLLSSHTSAPGHASLSSPAPSTAYTSPTHPRQSELRSENPSPYSPSLRPGP